MTSRCSLRVAVPLLAAGLAVGGCTTLPPVSPAPPPGTAEHQESAEEWVGVDGYVEVQQGKRARDAGFVAIRNYCDGDFEVVREKTRTTMTVLSGLVGRPSAWLCPRGRVDGRPLLVDLHWQQMKRIGRQLRASRW